jgi:hypothetical protein
MFAVGDLETVFNAEFVGMLDLSPYQVSLA